MKDSQGGAEAEPAGAQAVRTDSASEQDGRAEFVEANADIRNAHYASSEGSAALVYALGAVALAVMGGAKLVASAIREAK